MFKKILFATTASPACDNAAKVAFDLEMKWDAKLCVFHVLGVPSRGFSSFVTDVRTGEDRADRPGLRGLGEGGDEAYLRRSSQRQR